MTSPVYLFIAGDPSGDRHSAAIVHNLRKHNPSCRCIGIGGPEMQAAGFIPLLPFEPFNRMGIFEVITHLHFFIKARKQLLDFIRNEKPACLVCVDYSGFNIPMMKTAARMGIPVVWYIVPMVWAWGKKRTVVLGRYAAHICCIFPFEAPFFLPFTDRVSFVGNPLVEEMTNNNRMPCCKDTLPRDPLLAIIPGSRRQEVNRMLKPMVGAYTLLKKKHPAIKAVVSRYALLPEKLFLDTCRGTDIEIYTGPLSTLLLKADVALVTSGTATLETALFGVPHVVAYRTSFITYEILRHFVTISYVGLPNIIAGETVVPECIQQSVTEAALFEHIDRFVSDTSLYRKTAEKLREIRNLLGSEKPSQAVADIIRKNSSAQLSETIGGSA